VIHKVIWAAENIRHVFFFNNSQSDVSIKMNLNFNELLGCGRKYEIKSRWDLEPRWPILQQDEIKIIDVIHSYLMQVKDAEIMVSGVRVPITADLPPYVVYLLLNDAYEHGDIQLVRTHIKEDDSAIMIGAGIGIVATALAQQTHKSVLAIDANAALKTNIELCAKANRVDIQFITGAIADAEAGSTVPFTLSKEFWSSSLNGNTYLADRVISVNALSLETILKKAEFNTLFVDIEGAETFIFKRPIHHAVKKLFVEVHRPNIGATAWASVMNDIFLQGFQLKDAAGLTTYWCR
jgi:FkbM family methyltransferase